MVSLDLLTIQFKLDISALSTTAAPIHLANKQVAKYNCPLGTTICKNAREQCQVCASTILRTNNSTTLLSAAWPICTRYVLVTYYSYTSDSTNKQQDAAHLARVPILLAHAAQDHAHSSRI